jgi:hypothetical protein
VWNGVLTQMSLSTACECRLSDAAACHSVLRPLLLLLLLLLLLPHLAGWCYCSLLRPRLRPSRVAPTAQLASATAQRQKRPSRCVCAGERGGLGRGTSKA